MKLGVIEFTCSDVTEEAQTQVCYDGCADVASDQTVYTKGSGNRIPPEAARRNEQRDVAKLAHVCDEAPSSCKAEGACWRSLELGKIEAEQQYTHMPLSYQGVRAWPGYVRFSKGPSGLDPVPLGCQQMEQQKHVRLTSGTWRGICVVRPRLWGLARIR